ncbi:hypothetical protein Aple_091450 [Acrocarpospora pleiomorpha]|uniref:Uncharacterized protein n=1 Tax=Acrocarpospora pleiomorpha TaxID=90975 RepID=A0A5M3XZA7_9ACTN|nr:hypothetical protein Aple_091450 [Acrocarpospora pleiomorpha]
MSVGDDNRSLGFAELMLELFRLGAHAQKPNSILWTANLNLLQLCPCDSHSRRSQHAQEKTPVHDLHVYRVDQAGNSAV